MPVNVNEIEPDEKIVEIEMERLREFRNHPFKVNGEFHSVFCKGGGGQRGRKQYFQICTKV